MSQVYTFCKSGGSKSTTNPTSTNLTSTNQVPASYKPATEGTYSFRKEAPKADATQPLSFTDDDFPSLGGGKVSAPVPSKNIGSWGDASKSAIIREPFPDQVIAPRKDIPPLFSKVKKTKKVIYDDYDEDESYDEYDESESEEESGQGFGNTGYGDYEDEEF